MNDEAVIDEAPSPMIRLSPIPAGVLSVVAALFIIGSVPDPALAQTRTQTRTEAEFEGHRIIIPQSSVPQTGRAHTNYFFVDSDVPTASGPPAGTETPGSVACVYELVTGPSGCPVATSTNVPSGGWGAIAIVDAGDYPTAAADLQAFSSYFGLPAADFKIMYSGAKPPVYSDWEVEEALDIEWAHAMAPKAKLFLVVSKQIDTDPTWGAVQYAANLVAKNGGGVVSMSWGDPEVRQELDWDKNFTKPGVVYFAAAGDSGIGIGIYPGASPNVVSVGGTHFERDESGNFENEVYYTGGGGGDISPFEPIPSYQSGIAAIVGTHRGYPDVAADFCCAAVYVEGGWLSVGGTSWATPTFAGIVDGAGNKQQSTSDELTRIYGEFADPSEYSADFYDITQGDPRCTVGWNLCAGVGSPRTYAGK